MSGLRMGSSETHTGGPQGHQPQPVPPGTQLGLFRSGFAKRSHQGLRTVLGDTERRREGSLQVKRTVRAYGPSLGICGVSRGGFASPGVAGPVFVSLQFHLAEPQPPA